MATNALFINFGGLGDGLIEIPFLRAMSTASPSLRFHHTGGALFKDAAFIERSEIETLQGTVPSAWRKFATSDWPAINRFVAEHDVRLIINTRTLGPKYDQNYFAFRRAAPKHISFMNFPFESWLGESINIREHLNTLLNSEGLIQFVDPHSLLKVCARQTTSSDRRRVGVNIHSGSKFKLWPDEKWLDLCLQLAEGNALDIFGGLGDDETRRAYELTHRLNLRHGGCARMMQATDVLDLLRLVSSVACVVSTDSWTVHAASGLGTPSVGLYITTSASMWGGGQGAFAIESRHLRRCENFDRHLGICRNRYVECPLLAEEGDGIDVADVVSLVELALNVGTHEVDRVR